MVKRKGGEGRVTPRKRESQWKMVVMNEAGKRYHPQERSLSPLSSSSSLPSSLHTSKEGPFVKILSPSPPFQSLRKRPRLLSLPSPLLSGRKKR